MKIFILILFLNNTTGDIEGATKGGPAPTVHACMSGAAKLLDDNKAEIPTGTYPFIICNDVSEIAKSGPPKSDSPSADDKAPAREPVNPNNGRPVERTQT